MVKLPTIPWRIWRVTAALWNTDAFKTNSYNYKNWNSVVYNADDVSKIFYDSLISFAANIGLLWYFNQYCHNSLLNIKGGHYSSSLVMWYAAYILT